MLRSAWFLSIGISILYLLPRFLNSQRISELFPAWFAVNYWQFGFIRRGLLGSLISPAHSVLQLDWPRSTLVLFGLLLIIYATLFWRLTQYASTSIDRNQHGTWIIFVAFLCFSPLTFQHFAYDAGRTDVAWLSCLAASLLLLLPHDTSQDPPPSLATTLLVSAWTCAALLIYESTLFYIVPLLAVCLALPPRLPSAVAQPSPAWKALILFASFVTACLAALFLWGNFEPGATALQSRLAELFPGLNDSLSIVITGDLVASNRDILAQTTYNFLCNSIPLSLIAALWLAVLLSLIRASTNRFKACLLLGTPMLGFSNNFVALDFARYASLVFNVSALSVLFLLVLDPASGRGFLRLRSVMVLLLLTCLLGPVGIGPADPFPLLRLLGSPLR